VRLDFLLKLLMTIIMSVGRDYISELRPLASLIVIPQVIYEHGEVWCNNVQKGKLLVRPPELSANPTSSHLVAKQEELENKMNFALRSTYLFRTSNGYSTCRKM
jgi:hypothetical protein